jgi:hypothetical protein
MPEAGGNPKNRIIFLRGVCLMKITQMIHDTVVKPDRHPIYALMALALLLMAFVALGALACLGGAGAANMLKAIW